MDVKYIHWLGRSGFRIEDGTMQIYIDPYKISSNNPKADIIFITHSHYDHFSMEDISKIKKEGTIFVAPSDAAVKIGGSTIVVIPGQKYSVATLTVLTVPAYNLNKKFHPKENNWVGYIITLSNGQKIYHAGDTDFIPEMRSVSTDVALLPCGGTYTMTAKEAADAANIFKPKVLIPMHFINMDRFKAESEEVKKLFKGETAIKNLER